jgi:carbamoyl-phosphate synthase small subunit
MTSIEPAVLVLEDGTRYEGRAYGARGRTLGEAVFATGMTGYQETLTDPSYAGQIVVQTAPHIGNTGMNDEDPESRRIWVAGYVVRDPSRVVSNFRAKRSLDDELADTGIVGISGIDTRAITRRLRDSGAMRAGVFSGPDAALTADEQLAIVRAAPSMTGLNLSEEVSVTEAVVTPAVGEKIGNLAILDLGIKQSTVDNLAERGFEVHVLPQNVTLEQVLAIDPVAAFYSNGPGDPEASDAHVALLRELLDRELPFFGICFGNQLLGRALGFGTYKLPFGHRGINQPVLDKTTGKVEITAHNHGFAVDAPLDGPVDSPNGYGKVEVSHVGLNDQVVEGLRALDIPAFSVQYHPEAAAGPHDANYLFDRFRDMVLANRTTRGLSSAPRSGTRIETLGLSSAPRSGTRIETTPAGNSDDGFDTRPPSAGATQPAERAEESDK